MAEFKHITVLLNEAVDGLNIKPDGTYVDCTLGGGGHSGLILSKLSENGKLYSFDQDITAINFNKDKFEEENELGKINFIKSNFRNISEELNKRNISGVDGILYDLGVSSPQFDNADRGFSYNYDAPLDMRMDQSQSLTARDVVNDWSYEQLVEFSSVTVKKNLLSQLLVELRKLDKRQLRQLVNWLILLKKLFRLRPARKVDIS